MRSTGPTGERQLAARRLSESQAPVCGSGVPGNYAHCPCLASNSPLRPLHCFETIHESMLCAGAGRGQETDVNDLTVPCSPAPPNKPSAYAGVMLPMFVPLLLSGCAQRAAKGGYGSVIADCVGACVDDHCKLPEGAQVCKTCVIGQGMFFYDPQLSMNQSRPLGYANFNVSLSLLTVSAINETISCI